MIVDISKDSAHIEWLPPLSDGGSPITNYRIEKRTVGTYRWDLVNPSERVTGTSYTVRGLLEETDYEFRVIAENKAGVSQPSPGSRSAKYIEPVEFLEPLRNVKVDRLGGRVKFECEITKEDARAHWLKDGHEIYPDKKYDIECEGRYYCLTVNNIDSEDAGDYGIVVKGHRSEAKLQVEAQPIFTTENLYESPLVIKAGSSAVIEVPFQGSPQPRVSWKVDGHGILESRRLHHDTIYNMTSMTIKRAEMDDAGLYSVHLNNPFGTTTLDIEVIVLGE